MPIEFDVKSKSRLDRALREAGPLSVRAAKEAIQDGKLRVNGHIVKKPAFEVRPGDRVVCALDANAPVKTAPVPVKPRKDTMTVLYEDADLIAVDKPPGVLSVRTSFSDERSVKDWVEDYLADQMPRRHAHAVHRLDRMASGVLLFAKDPLTRDRVMDAFKKRRVIKAYLAVTHAIPKDRMRRGSIELPINDQRGERVVVVGSGKPAQTDYEVLEENDTSALVRAIARTGRRHQVRAHLAEALAPIQGDAYYGKVENDGKRLLLHCVEITLNHPSSGDRLSLNSRAPNIFSLK